LKNHGIPWTAKVPAGLHSDETYLTIVSMSVQQFAIPRHPSLLPWLKRPLFSCNLPLQRLRAFQCVNCGPEIWKIIPRFSQLSRLSLRNHSCDLSTLHLQACSLPIEHILLEGCNIASQAICVMIRSCKHLVSFQYLRPLSGQEAFFRPCIPQCSRYI
jgi:hypothetical protein